MKIGLQLIRFDWPDTPYETGRRLSEIDRLAEEAKFGSLLVMDHFFQMGDEFGPANDPMLEGYSTIAYLAALTQRIRLGVLVAGNIYHYPGLLIKTISTLDVLSGGRVYFGIGASWYKREAQGLGIPFPSLQERFERLEETLQIAKHMWSGNWASYHGHYYQLQEPINCPQPIQQPHPPILVGGEGEKKTLRLLAQYGDACNLFAGGNSQEYAAGVESIRSKLAILQQHCEQLGRPYQEIERTALAGIHLAKGNQSINEVLQLCQALAKLGIQHVIFNMPNAHEMKPLEMIGKELIPAMTNFD